VKSRKWKVGTKTVGLYRTFHFPLERSDFQAAHQRGVPVAGQAFLERSDHGRAVAAEQCRRVQPETRKDCAPVDAGGVRGEGFVGAFPQDEPVDRPVQHPPHDILPDAGAPVDVQLHVQIVADAAGCHLHDELRPSQDIAIPVDLCLASG
jgi:hypothetical protein